MHESPLAFSLLGPLEVWASGRLIELPRRKQRLLLTLLLLQLGEVVSADRLIGNMWGEKPPRAAVGSLQNLVCGLRKELGSEVVRTQAAGYAVDVEREYVDLYRFRALIAAAHEEPSADLRAEQLREALGLWRGQPLAEFVYEEFAQIEMGRLDELRIAACEELIEAELELSRHRQLIGELEALVVEHPLRERLRAQLMLALYRSGRQTEALAAYEDARRTLTEDLGLEPSEELRRLQRAILAHDPVLEPSGAMSFPHRSRMEFRLLGPIEAKADGELLHLGKTKQRALLAYLLLHANRVVSRDQLTNALWGDDAPETAATALHGYVSGLRKAIGGDRIETRAPGYVLHVAAAELDLAIFERLRGEARDLEPEAAVERLELALSLWRGAPLADLDAVPFATVERLLLEELRLGAVEERNDAYLALGRHSEVVAELQALVHEHPLRERLRGQLMLALYRSGRQAEALDVYQSGRRRLAEELGLEPDKSLKRLEHAILEQDPALLRSPATVGSAVPRGAGSIGRRSVVAALATVVLAAAVAVVGVLAWASGDGVSVVPNSIAIVDSETNRVVGDVALGRQPTAVSFGIGAVWVGSGDDGMLTRISPAMRKVAEVTPIGTDIRDIATGFGSVWLADGKDGTVTRFVPKRNTITKIHLHERQAASAPVVDWIATGAGVVWAAQGSTLIEIDPETNDAVARTNIPRPRGLAAGLGAAWIVTDDHRLLRVTSRRPAPAKITLQVPLTDAGLAPTVGAGSVWLIVEEGTGEIWRIDPSNPGVPRIIPGTGRYPLDLAVADRSDYVWAVDSTGGLLRINPTIDLVVAEIRTAPTRQSAIAVGAGAVWIVVQD
jgi:DNA-binding SARP family transcriptional activator